MVSGICHFCSGWCRDRYSHITTISPGMAEFYETGWECYCTSVIHGSVRVLFEAIFLGIYLYTWDRFKNPYIHWLLTIPIVAGAGMSAVFITTVNGFMNQPGGFVMEAGQFTAIDPVQAMLNTATFSKVFHVLSSAYLTGAALLADCSLCDAEKRSVRIPQKILESHDGGRFAVQLAEHISW